MINNRIRNLIYPNLKMELEEEEWKYIDYMLDNAYYSIENGRGLVSLPPPPSSDNKYCLQFSALNGTFVSIDFWEVVQIKGVKV